MSSRSFVCVFCQGAHFDICLTRLRPLNDIITSDPITNNHDHISYKSKTLLLSHPIICRLQLTDNVYIFFFLCMRFSQNRVLSHHCHLRIMEQEPSTSSDLPLVCPNCYLNYRDFIHYYYGNISRIIDCTSSVIR